MKLLEEYRSDKYKKLVREAAIQSRAHANDRNTFERNATSPNKLGIRGAETMRALVPAFFREHIDPGKTVPGLGLRTCYSSHTYGGFHV